MDHEVVQGLCKLYDWLLNSSRDHFGLHQRENSRVTMEVEVPDKHVIRPTLSTDMVQRVLQWERQCHGMWRWWLHLIRGIPLKSKWMKSHKLGAAANAAYRVEVYCVCVPLLCFSFIC